MKWFTWGASVSGQVMRSLLIEREDVSRFACANDHPDAEAVLIPDTALHTVDFLPELEAAVGKTVLTGKSGNDVGSIDGLRTV